MHSKCFLRGVRKINLYRKPYFFPAVRDVIRDCNELRSYCKRIQQIKGGVIFEKGIVNSNGNCCCIYGDSVWRK